MFFSVALNFKVILGPMMYNVCQCGFKAMPGPVGQYCFSVWSNSLRQCAFKVTPRPAVLVSVVLNFKVMPGPQVIVSVLWK